MTELASTISLTDNLKYSQSWPQELGPTVNPENAGWVGKLLDHVQYNSLNERDFFNISLDNNKNKTINIESPDLINFNQKIKKHLFIEGRKDQVILCGGENIDPVKLRKIFLNQALKESYQFEQVHLFSLKDTRLNQVCAVLIEVSHDDYDQFLKQAKIDLQKDPQSWSQYLRRFYENKFFQEIPQAERPRFFHIIPKISLAQFDDKTIKVKTSELREWMQWLYDSRSSLMHIGQFSQHFHLFIHGAFAHKEEILWQFSSYSSKKSEQSFYALDLPGHSLDSNTSLYPKSLIDLCEQFFLSLKNDLDFHWPKTIVFHGYSMGGRWLLDQLFHDRLSFLNLWKKYSLSACKLNLISSAFGLPDPQHCHTDFLPQFLQSRDQRLLWDDEWMTYLSELPAKDFFTRWQQQNLFHDPHSTNSPLPSFLERVIAIEEKKLRNQAEFIESFKKLSPANLKDFAKDPKHLEELPIEQLNLFIGEHDHKYRGWAKWLERIGPTLKHCYKTYFIKDRSHRIRLDEI